jgi:hypothetical protein
MKSRHKAGTFIVTNEEKLGRTTLTITVVFVFVSFVLAALLLLSGLSRLTGLVLLLLAGLALSELVTLLLIFFLHIVCHKYVLLKKREPTALFEI